MGDSKSDNLSKDVEKLRSLLMERIQGLVVTYGGQGRTGKTPKGKYLRLNAADVITSGRTPVELVVVHEDLTKAGFVLQTNFDPEFPFAYALFIDALSDLKSLKNGPVQGKMYGLMEGIVTDPLFSRLRVKGLAKLVDRLQDGFYLRGDGGGSSGAYPIRGVVASQRIPLINGRSGKEPIGLLVEAEPDPRLYTSLDMRLKELAIPYSGEVLAK